MNGRMSSEQFCMLMYLFVCARLVFSGDVRTDRFLITDDQPNANTSAPVFSDNTFPKVLLCQVNQSCSVALPVDSKRTETPHVQHGHHDPGLVVEPIRVWNKQPFICDSSRARCPYEAVVTVMPTEEKAYQYCVQTTDEDKTNADERCYIIQGTQDNLMNKSSHFNYPPTLPNNATMSCPRNVTCHYTIDFQRHGGSCQPPRVIPASNMLIKVIQAEVKQYACRYDVEYTPSVDAVGDKAICVVINKSSVEKHCVNVDVTSKSPIELAGPCSLIYCAMGSFCDSVNGKSRCLCQPGYTGKNCDKPVHCSVSFPSSVTCPDQDCHVTGIAIGTQQVTSSGNIVDVQKDANNGRMNIVHIQRTGNDSEICFNVNHSDCRREGCVSVIPDNHYLPPNYLPGSFSSNNITYNCNTEVDCYLTVTTYPLTNTTCADMTVHTNTTVNNQRVFPTTLNGSQCTTTVVVTGTTKQGEKQQLCLQTTSGVKCLHITVKDFEKCSTNPCKNGGTCAALLIGYSCTCNAGWTGGNCATNINECIPNPCQNGICNDGINNYTCTCNDGYAGRHCETDINECSPDPCQNGVCVDGINDYKCTCQAGYSGHNCETDINECSSNPCQNGTCHDEINSYTCMCEAGYTGRHCETDLDECNSYPCKHGICVDDGICVDGINSYTCTCHTGYFCRNCETDVNECIPNPCQNGTCVDGINNYTCTCQDGYSGYYCETDECSINPCQNGLCIDSINHYSCTCQAGYSGRNCETDIDECSPNPCRNGTCVDEINKYTCTCQDGYSGRNCGTDIDECSPNPCQNGICTDGINNYTCTCQAGYSGRNCETDIDECSPNPCRNGTCVDGINKYTCTCQDGYSGRNCETDIDECSPNPCQNGICTDGINNYTCTCQAGYSGRNCETDVDECSQDPCQNGVCVDGINNYTCTCQAGYSGRNCETDINECSPDPCQNGLCHDGINGYTCTCDSGYTDLTCSTDINECSPDPCSHGKCVDGLNRYSCTCDVGYGGFNCDTDIDECSPDPCINGTCIDGINNYTCTCDTGFSGRDCGMNIDDCVCNPCQNGGTCWDGVDTYVCQCDLGYTGLHCETDINECLSNPCLNGAKCSDLLDSFKCTCRADFTGRFCETRALHCHPGECLNGGACVNGTCHCRTGYKGEHCQIYLDPCNSFPCLRGSCYHHETDFYCDCPDGYTGKMCEVLINNCDPKPCLNGGTCVNGLNMFTCTCLSGFTGDRCQTDINECYSQPCMHGGNCIDGFNSFTCQCQYGYGGDRCQKVTDFCIQQPCVRGTCFSRATGYHCTCPSAYTGKTCDTIKAMAVNGPARVNITVPDGGDILMNCSVIGKPTNYHWSKMNGCDGPQKTAGGSKLQIHGAARGDSGIYTCTASNGHDPNVTKTFDVKVNTNQSEKCVFNRNTSCSWKQEHADKFDWTKQSGSTQSSGTGPDNDHTIGNSNGAYLYIESSSPRLQGDYASLLSERLTANHTMCLEFWYYMYGDGIGNLTVKLEDSCFHKETEVFKKAGEQGQKWIKASITIPSNLVPNDYTIKLTGDIGPTFKGDTAIDDLSLRDGSCTNSPKVSNVALVG